MNIDLTKKLINNIENIMLFSFAIAAVLIIVLMFTDSGTVISNAINGGLIASLLAIAGTLFMAVTKYIFEAKKQEQQNYFSLSATSHMAQVAFDRHVEFCEEYINELQLIIHELFRDANHKKGMDYFYQLKAIKDKHRVWVTQSIETVLKPVESALWNMGRAGTFHRFNNTKLGIAYALFGELIQGHEQVKQEWIALDTKTKYDDNVSVYDRKEIEKKVEEQVDGGILAAIHALQNKLQIDKYVAMREAIVNHAHHHYNKARS